MKRLNYEHVLLFAIALTITAVLYLFSRPRIYEATSPDRRLLAHVVAPSLLSILVEQEGQDWDKKMRVRIWVTDLRTGEKVKAHDKVSNGLLGGDGEWPTGIAWGKDYKELIYDYLVEPTSKRTIFSVHVQPLRLRIKSSPFS